MNADDIKEALGWAAQFKENYLKSGDIHYRAVCQARKGLQNLKIKFPLSDCLGDVLWDVECFREKADQKFLEKGRYER